MIAGKNGLRDVGIDHMITEGPYFADAVVSIGIRTGEGPLVLTISRKLDPKSYGFAETRRELIEGLIEQLNKQLAVEALEGR